MRTINLLPHHLISKIAAGEVVERPASVVKELIENSLDAHASHITIYLEEGGTKRIVVKDDGIGMNPEDVLLSYQPHTTSKITSDEDLFSIKSFGFRGEALSSIAAVSSVTIKSRTKDSEHGTEIEVKEGMLENSSCIGMPCGTEIIVESLFSSIPARKKFLKEHAVELRHVIDIVTRIALSYPQIGFKLMHEKTVLLDLPDNQTILERMESVLGQHITQEVIPIEHETRYGNVHGYIGRPQLAARSRQHQHVFVNSRSIIDPSISQAITESYGNLLEPRAFPPFVIYISLPFENVDVNIHPRKEEVGFVHQDEIKKLIQEAVKISLDKHDLTYKERAPTDEFGMDRQTAAMLRELVTPWNLKSEDGALAVLQIKNLYLVTMTDNGLLIVDQHAAHERILFEQFKDAFVSSQDNPSLYELEQPLVFTLSVSESLALEEKIEVFQKLGFDLESFGHNSFKLNAVPEIFKSRNYVQLITEVLHDLKDGREKNIDRETERTLSFLACRTAIKGGEALGPDERKKLIEKLLESKTLYTCPHGRPTHIELPISHLDTLFKRR